MNIVHWMSRSFSRRGTPAEPLTDVFIRTSFHKYVNSILDKTNIKWYTATHARCSISFSVFRFPYSIFPLRIVSISFSPRCISISSGLHSSTTLSRRISLVTGCPCMITELVGVRVGRYVVGFVNLRASRRWRRWYDLSKRTRACGHRTRFCNHAVC